MSSNITLSAATRQNLLSLQDTASLLSTTQSRLSTGKKVNSALDNPTNFFTSQSLTARSSDLSNLLDGISNGVQVIQAANQGITSITKLIDTAKSTAQQALADKTGGSSGATGGDKAQAAKVIGTSTLAGLGTTANGVTTFDLSSAAKDASLDISLDGGTTKTTIRLDATTLASSGTDLTKVTSDQLLTAISGQIANNATLKDKVTASFSADGRLSFTTTTAGSAAKLTVAGSANSTIDIGYGKSTRTPTAATVTANAALAAATDFSTGSASLVVSDGNTSVNIKLDKNSATDTSGGTLGTSATRQKVLDAINKQLKDSGSTVTASLSNDKLVFSSADVGPDAQISVIGGLDTTGGNNANGIGFSTFTASAPTVGPAATSSTTPQTGVYTAPTLVNGGAAVSTATSTKTITFPLTLGTGQQTSFTVEGAKITIDANSLDAVGNPIGSSITSTELTDAINRQLTAAGKAITASAPAGVLTLQTDAATGANITMATSGTGLTDQLGLFGTPATTRLGTALDNNLDLKGKSATFTVGSTSVTLDATKPDASGVAIGTNPNRQSVVEALNAQLSASGQSAYIDGTGHLTFVGPNSATAAPTITAASDTIGLGIGTANSLTATGTVSTPSTSSTARVQVAGTSPATFTAFATNTFKVGDGTTTADISVGVGTAYPGSPGGNLTATPTQDQVTAAIQKQLDDQGVNVTASFQGGKLTFDSKGVGANASVTLTPGTDGATTSGLGIGSAGAGNPPLTANGVSAGAIDLSGGKSSAFTIGDGATSKAVTISATSLDKDGNQIGASATQAKVAEAIQVQLNTGGVKATVSFVGNQLKIAGNAVGAGAAAPTLRVDRDTAGLGLGTTTTTGSTPAAGDGKAADGVTSSGTEATDGSSKAAIVGNEIAGSTRDFSGTNDASFTLKLGSGPLKLITLNNTTFGNSSQVSQSAIAKAINDQISADTGLAGKVSASYVNNKLVISTTDSGSDQKLTVTAAPTVGATITAVDIGFGGRGATAQTASGTDVGGSKGVSSVRSTLATQFNQILQQITQQAQDSGYNGLNLLFRNSNSAADNTLHIAFNEKNTSALDIGGVRFDATGLGLETISGGFQTDTEINAAIEKLTSATSQLRTQSSTFGANLSVVQNRQDFSKSMINILDTGAGNLVNADLNEEAANSQALSTRNSLAVSALSLANQAQQGILQLLR